MRSSVIDPLSLIFPADRLSADPTILTDYSHDQGPVLAAQLPAAVVWPESTHEVQALMRWASETGTPVIPRGSGTGVSGAANAHSDSIIISFERMNKILEISPDDETARVQPGVINAELNEAVAQHQLMYAPDPASFAISTIGGNVATNAGGLRCAKYGVTRDSVLALDVVLADGALIHTGHNTFKGVAGYDLTGLIVGSEGTLGIVTEITVRLKYLPTQTEHLAVFFPDFATAAAGVQAIGTARVQPSIIELINDTALSSLDERFGSTLRDFGNALLLIQCDGYGANTEMSIVMQALAQFSGNMDNLNPVEAKALIDLRRRSRGLDVEQQLRVGEDVAVPRSRLVDYVSGLYEIAARHDILLEIVAHAGDGNLHPTLYVHTEPEPSQATVQQQLARLDAALDESIELALSFGGTITGEHGIGEYKLRWLGLEHSAELQKVQRSIKNTLDPNNLLNPGKAIL